MDLAALAREVRLIAARGGGFGSDVEVALKALADALDLRPEWQAKDLEKALKPKASRAKKSTTFDAAGGELVTRYVEQLQRKQPASEALRLVDAMLKDKGVKRDVLFEIAGRFLGAKLSFTNKAQAEAAIRDKLTRRDWDQGSIRIIGDRVKS